MRCASQIGLCLVALGLWAPPAHAEDPELVPPGTDAQTIEVSADVILAQPSLRPFRLSYGEMIAQGFTAFGDELGTHMKALSGDLIRFKLDGHGRRAFLRVGHRGRQSGLELDSNVHFRHGVARVDARLALKVDGRLLSIKLPDFELATQSLGGERFLEIRLPLVEGTF